MLLTIMNGKEIYYHGFAYPAHQLSAYIFTIDTFIISLRDGTVVRHTPRDVQAFHAWLDAHHIRDISRDNGLTRIHQD